MALNTWVSDKLHDILGFSDKHAVEYLVSLSQSTKTSESFREKLQGFLGPLDGDVLNFANDLWQRAPHQEVMLKLFIPMHAAIDVLCVKYTVHYYSIKH
jgi:hypothetical protein